MLCIRQEQSVQLLQCRCSAHSPRPGSNFTVRLRCSQARNSASSRVLSVSWRIPSTRTRVEKHDLSRFSRKVAWSVGGSQAPPRKLKFERGRRWLRRFVGDRQSFPVCHCVCFHAVRLHLRISCRFRQNEDTLATVVTSLFPSLVEIATRMAQVPPAEASPEIPVMLHYILKAYKTSTTVGLSEHQRSAESLVPWAKLLFQMVSLDIPKGVVPENEEERERSEWWKAKKWAFATLGRLFHRCVASGCNFEKLIEANENPDTATLRNFPRL